MTSQCQLLNPCGWFFWYSLEWVSLIRLLDGLQDSLVYPEADGDGQQGQADVGAHAHDAAHGQGEKQQQGGAKHHTCVLHIAPVQEIHHCRRTNRTQSRHPLNQQSFFRRLQPNSEFIHVKWRRSDGSFRPRAATNTPDRQDRSTNQQNPFHLFFKSVLFFTAFPFKTHQLPFVPHTNSFQWEMKAKGLRILNKWTNTTRITKRRTSITLLLLCPSLFRHVLLFTSFHSKQKCPVLGQSKTDQAQGSVLDPTKLSGLCPDRWTFPIWFQKSPSNPQTWKTWTSCWHAKPFSIQKYQSETHFVLIPCTRMDRLNWWIVLRFSCFRHTEVSTCLLD